MRRAAPVFSFIFIPEKTIFLFVYSTPGAFISALFPFSRLQIILFCFLFLNAARTGSGPGPAAPFMFCAAFSAFFLYLFPRPLLFLQNFYNFFLAFLHFPIAFLQ